MRGKEGVKSIQAKQVVQLTIKRTAPQHRAKESLRKFYVAVQYILSEE
jgi:hypothetical protein